ncbi:MAG: rhodanese-like domain-containing protein [Candidatus Didemnitutus sp.]|nr:rhodanese-like domain-containing protein [Candidatus Didemnitutus sp.]
MNWFLLLFSGVAAIFIIRTLILARPGISAEQARAVLNSGAAVLVDVREAGEWAGGTARHAALLPLSDLRGERTQWRAFLAKHKGKQLLLYCRSGSRSGMAAAQLRREGFNAVNAGSAGIWVQ